MEYLLYILFCISVITMVYFLICMFNKNLSGSKQAEASECFGINLAISVCLLLIIWVMPCPFLDPVSEIIYIEPLPQSETTMYQLNDDEGLRYFDGHLEETISITQEYVKTYYEEKLDKPYMKLEYDRFIDGSKTLTGIDIYVKK